MATSTNYSYDEITGYSKLLLNTYDGDKTLSVLQTLSDASAGLNLDSSDVNMFISGLSRMRTTGKATQEYLTSPNGAWMCIRRWPTPPARTSRRLPRW